MPGEPADNGLSAKQEQAIAALLEEATIMEAAGRVGVDRGTITRWLKDPTFAAAYGKARAQVVDHAISKLQRLTSKAVDALESNLRTKNRNARNTAARAILDFSMRAIETQELRDRVQELERRIEDMRTAGADRHDEGALADDEED